MFGAARVREFHHGLAFKTSAKNLYPISYYEKKMVAFLFDELYKLTNNKEVGHCAIACPGRRD
jgi:hypothetical protein